MNKFINPLKSEFGRNVLTLMTGTTIAQAIPIAIMPILTRIYPPESFGVFALFLAITAVGASMATGQYEQAIVLPKSKKDALSIVILSIVITFGLSIVLLLMIIIFNNQIVNLLNNSEIKSWLYFIPLSVFLVGVYNSLNFFNIRKKKI